jgi:formylglycine-generating enzyme required for sulfatase activity
MIQVRSEQRKFKREDSSMMGKKIVIEKQAKFLTLLFALCYLLFAATTCSLEGDVFKVREKMVSIPMVWISAGTFQMGSPISERERIAVRETQHQVTLTSGFWMGKYQVTQEQWQTVMGSNPSNFSSDPSPGEVQGRRPVERVSWYDALVFCNRLSMMEGLSPAYRINNSTNPNDWGTVPTSSDSTWNSVVVVYGSTGYRLPTEAQWEYACRAGTTTAFYNGNNYDGGTGYDADLVGLAAWFTSNSGSMTHQVGLKTPNARGLYDMHGNVLEWCWDWFAENYGGTGVQTDPTGASSGTYRVRRGGSWGNSAQYVRSAFRGIDTPSYRSYIGGFRVVRP